MTEAGSRSLDTFERHRGRLFGIAYGMLGSVADADDVVQDAYVRWHQQDESVVRTPRSWLVTVTTRLALDRLRRAEVERERYPGHWLPEPVATPPDRRAEISSDLSTALLVLLERLGPEERAAFVMREVFDAEYSELAAVFERSEAACRKMVQRARERVQADRVRFEVSPETHERLLERFLKALHAQDMDGLLTLISPDVTWSSDGGGKVPAARRIVGGADRVARLLLGLEAKVWEGAHHTIMSLNHAPALVSYVGGRAVSATAVVTDGERLLAFYCVVNPDKLSSMAGRRSAGGKEA